MSKDIHSKSDFGASAGGCLPSANGYGVGLQIIDIGLDMEVSQALCIQAAIRDAAAFSSAPLPAGKDLGHADLDLNLDTGESVYYDCNGNGYVDGVLKDGNRTDIDLSKDRVTFQALAVGPSKFDLEL